MSSSLDVPVPRVPLRDALLEAGAEVVWIDIFSTDREDNVANLFGYSRISVAVQDVSRYIFVPGPVGAALHLVSSASPVDYLNLPILTLKVGSLGTHTMR